MRRLVLQELEQDIGRKRGVKKVWDALKSKGQHIKRCAVSFLPLLTASLAYLSDFVEKVMKDVYPNGFKERRPRWKPETIARLSDAADQALLPLKVPPAASTSSQHASRVMAPPIIVDQSTDTRVEMEAHPVPQSLDYSNGHQKLNAQPLGFEIFPGAGSMAGDSSLSSGVYDIGEGGLGNGVGEDWGIDGDSSPLLNPEAQGISGSVAIDRHARNQDVKIHSLLTVFQADAPRCDIRGDDQVQHSSGTTGTTRMASGCSTPVLVPTQSDPETDTVSMGESEASAESGELFRHWF